MPSSDITAALAALISVQNAQGGWGWRRGASANTECTALAVLALAAWHGVHAGSARPLRGGVAWLEANQHDDGSWPMGEQVPESSWMTSVATLALAAAAPDGGHAVRGGEWLVGNRSRGLSFIQRLAMRFSSRPSAVDQDPELIGWPWAGDTAAWVEPTSWAMLALKQLRPSLPRRATAERIEQGHLLLRDRMCRGGGWNYGNKAVLGFDLTPYPDTTALALIALHDQPLDGVTGPSVARLQEMMTENRSALVLALSILALQLYGRDISPEREELRLRLPALAADVEARTLALALLALDERQSHFRLMPDA